MRSFQIGEYASDDHHQVARSSSIGDRHRNNIFEAKKDGGREASRAEKRAKRRVSERVGGARRVGGVVEVVQLLLLDLLAKDVSLEKVGDLSDLVGSVLLRRHGKDAVQLFQRQSLGFGAEEEDETEQDQVPPSGG